MPKITKTETTKAAKPARTAHGIKASYDGPSNPLNRVRPGDAKTPIRVRPSATYSERVQSLVADLAATYGGKAFERGEIGAGALGRAIYLGCVVYVSGADSVETNDDGPVYYGRGAKFKIANAKSPHAPAHKRLAS